MYKEIQSTSLNTLTGRNDVVINCCCISGNTLYLGILDLGIVTCKVNRDGIVQFLTILSLPKIRRILNYGKNGSDRYLLDAGCLVFVWYRKKLTEFFKKGDDDEIYNFKQLTFVGLRLERRVDVYSITGRLFSSFETQWDPYRIFANSQYLFVFENGGNTRIYSNDGFFSLIKTLEGSYALHLDDRYLYCQEVSPLRHGSYERISLVNISSLKMTSYAVVRDFSYINGIERLRANKVLVKTSDCLCLFEFKSGKRLRHIWKSEETIINPICNSLFVLDSTAKQYICVDVQWNKVRTIIITD